MATVTLDLPPAAWERARAGALAAGCTVETYLVSRLAESEGDLVWARHVDLIGLSDDQLLVHIHAMVSPGVQERLSDLLERNGEGELAAGEREELEHLIRSAHVGMLIKAKALVEWKNRHGSLPEGFEPPAAPPDAKKSRRRKA
jgi:hypothetical protein